MNDFLLGFVGGISLSLMVMTPVFIVLISKPKVKKGKRRPFYRGLKQDEIESVMREIDREMEDSKEMESNFVIVRKRGEDSDF